MKNKILKFLINVIKGGLIGIAAVIPGFSGGTIACIIGIYDDLIEAISGIRKHFKESILILLPFVIGVAIFALAFISPISWGVDNYPFVTVSLFAGLLIGGLPSFYKNIEGKGSKGNVLCAILGALIVFAVLIPSFFSENNYVSLTAAPFWMYILLLVIGIVASAALVIPGISGSMILLIVGFYNPIMDTIKAFIVSLLGMDASSVDFSQKFDVSVVGKGYILPSFGLLACFGIGVIVGFFLISKLMKFLLSKYKYATYFAIFGFILASLVGIYTDKSYYVTDAGVWKLTPLQIFLAVLFLIVGFLTSFFLTKAAEKKEKQNIENNNEELVIKEETNDN